MKHVLSLLLMSTLLAIYTYPADDLPLFTNTSAMLVEKSVDPLPLSLSLSTQIKDPFSLNETIMERIIKDILSSGLEPGQKNDLIKGILDQQFEAKKNTLVSVLTFFAQYVIPLVASGIAVWKSTTK